jgi:bifunctional non-homologous end joining protein LigD
MHPFHTSGNRLETPDYAIFDFDPAAGSHWDQVVTGALGLKTVLDGLGLQGFPKLSGSKGLHVYLPLDPVHDYRRVRRFVDAVGRLLVAASPADFTMEPVVSNRTGMVFIDVNRNAFAQTVASVYSVRPAPGAPVSVPLAWDEVGSVRNGDVTIANLWDRHGDLFAPVLEGGQTLDDAEAALGVGE